MGQPIYLNGRFVTQVVTGVQRYATELVGALDRLITRGAGPPGHAWSLLIPPGSTGDLSFTSLTVQTIGRLRGHAWEQLELAAHSRDGVLLSFGNTGPLRHSRQIVTIHDASVFRHPEAYTFAFRTWYQFLLPRLARRAVSVLTDSDFSSSELSECLDIAPGRVRVVRLGGEHMLAVTPDSSILARHELEGRPYILVSGNRSPHKNLAVVAAAVELLPSQTFDVVVVGAHNPAVLRGVAQAWPTNTRWLGYVPDAQLRALYEHAACFVYPSLYEGFGLPPLEAMTCGCPVLLSRAAALPEVGGEAVRYFDPRSPDALARELDEVMGSPDLRTELRHRGLERAMEFSWQGAAAAVLRAVEEAVKA